MKFNLKLAIAALIILIFTVGAVSAGENVTVEADSIDQVSTIEIVSQSEPVQSVETPSLEATASDNIQDVTTETTSDTRETQIDEYESSSDNTKTSNSNDKTRKNSESVLSASNDEEVLGKTIYLSTNYFYSLRDAIDQAEDGDVIDLMGQTIIGSNPTISTKSKGITVTIINGTLNGGLIAQNDVSDYTNCHIENVSFINYRINHYRGLFFTQSYLKNVKFDNFIFFRDGMASHSSVFDNVTFRKMQGTRQGPPGNFEYGVTVVSYGGSKFYNCTFKDTHTNQHSGAICVAGVSGNIVTIIDCKFINCSSGVAGAVYVHGTDATADHHSNIINCEFINCSATEWGGAIGSSQDYLNVENCIFINNTAKQGAAFMVGGITHGLDGDNSQGHFNTMKNCYFYNNTGTEEGGAVHITGHNNSAVKCIFDDNFAVNGNGAAIYVEGNNASVINSIFTNHISDKGTVYIEGNHASVISSKFSNNNATHGGAGVFIHGNYSLVEDSRFENNDAHQHGGAIHTIGDHAKIRNSQFYYNDAIPTVVEDPDYGLGGAIYIDGDFNEVSFCKFQGNTARNGSAIYTNGHEFHVEDDEFIENQAWSYFLFTEAQPPVSYWSEDLEVVLNVTLIAGDNIINAIYNNGTIGDIYFHNVTYELSDTSLFNSSMRTTTEGEIHPVDGVEKSNGGRILYQDPREDNQRICLNITYKDSQVFYAGNLITNLYGNVLVPLTKNNMSDRQFHPGVYNVTASHPEDMLYTAIENTTTFTILPHVDIKVTKTSDKDVYIVGEKVIFTITVSGVGTNATNVVVRDILPDSFEYVSATASKGSYNRDTNEWTVGFLPHLAKESLTLIVKTTQLGTFNNVVIANCSEKDWNESNNIANKTVKVDLYYTKHASLHQTSAGETFEYYLRVYNTGNTLYNETVQIRDVLPKGIKFTGSYHVAGADLVDFTDYGDQQIWYVTNIRPNSYAQITVGAEALVDGIWNNSMYVWDFPPVNATVNVSSVADLHIFKDVQPAKVNKGDVVQWTITVINHGPSKAMDVVVSDLLPKGLDIVGVASTTKGVYTRTTGIWDIGTMDVEERVFLYINTTVLYSNANITNVAVVNSSTPDSNLTNNIANDTVESTPEGDVGIEKTVSNHNSNHNDLISWTIVVTNHGPDKATGVVVTDVVPNGLRIINTTESKGKKYNQASGKWDVGDLENGENATLVIWTRVTTYNTIINNIARVNTTSTDTNPNNDEDDDFTNVGPEADIELIKVADKHELVKGEIVVWTITIVNNGPNDAEDVIVTDILPNGLRFITSSSRRYDNNTGIWNVGFLANGGRDVLTITTEVTVSNANVENYAVVNSSTYDPDLSNNDDEDEIKVKTEADVGIVKLVSNKTAHYGDTVTWTIIVTNYGPNVAENVVVTDFIPEGLIIIGTPSHSQGHVVTNAPGNTGIWNIGTMQVNQSVTCIVTSTVNATGKTLINVVNVNTTSHDPDLTNNDAENRTVVPEECDIQVVKTVNNITPDKGDTVIWTVRIVNNGPDTARNVVVRDILPSGLGYVSHEIPEKGSYSHITGAWSVGDVLKGESLILKITTKVTDTGNITNEANVTTSTYDIDLSNNYDNETIMVPAIADLEIVKLVSNRTPDYGDLINWTIIVKNNGPNNARNVVVNDKLPQGLVYVTHNATAGLYDPTRGIWQIGDLLHFASVTLNITTRVNFTNATVTNIASVTSATPDSNETNNKANNTTTVGPVADLSIEKTVDNHGPRKGDNITWIITVTNNGPDDAINAVARDILPEGLIFISSTGDGSYSNETDLWTIGNIENGGTRVLYIVTTVNVTKSIITNIVNVTSDTPDPDETNNEDNSTIDVGHETDLEVIKTVSNSTPKYGDLIVWNITVINHGPDDAIETYVVDELPEGLIWISDNGNGTYNHETGIWTIGTLHNHTNITLLITTQVNVTNDTVVNVAVVDSDTHDTNESNNRDDDNITVSPLADLELFKLTNIYDVKYNDEVIWTIYVYNHGPDTAVGAYVIDKLPNGLIYQYDSSNGKYNATTGIWTIGDLPKDESAVLMITTTVNITSGTIKNFAVVNSSTEDPIPENNYGNDTVNVTSVTDLKIIKEVSNKNPHFGENISWTITVINKGPSDAYDVKVTDKLPQGLIYKTDDSNGKYNSTSGIWNIGFLKSGENVSLVITTLVNITNASITNVAVVNSTTPDNNESNNKVNNTTDVEPEADLSIVKTVSDKTAKFGDVITWIITVTNNGPDVAKNVYVRDTFPEELIYKSHSTTKGLFDSGSFTWFITQLANGETQKLTITATVNFTNKTIINIANVTNDIYDPNETNNEGNNTTDIEPKADLVVVKVVSNPNAKFGETITWTVTVKNNGPDAAVNVKVTDKLPSSLVYKGDDSNGKYDHENGIWTVGDLAKGASASIVITTVVNTTEGVIENIANATSDTPGNSTPGNNTTDVDPAADLVVVKLVSSSSAKKGDTITWTIIVTNNGPGIARGAYVVDELPNGLAYVNHNADIGIYDHTKGIWTIGDLNKDDSCRLVIVTVVTIDNGSVTNVAVVNSSTPDNNTDNNEGNNTTEITKEIADLEVVKLVSSSSAKKGDIVTWTIAVTNHGPGVARNVNVTDELPQGLFYVSHHADKGLYDSSRGIWTIGDLENGANIKLVIVTVVTIDNGTVTNVAVVNSSTPDNNTDNNGGNNTTEVFKDFADLEVVKIVSSSSAKKGDKITWTVIVTNHGPDAAVNVKVTDKLPDGLIYSSHKADVGLYDPSKGIWTLGDLQAEESFKLVIETIVNINNGTVTNVAVVNSSTPDNNTDNNEANNTTSIDENADLEIVKLVSNTTAHKGDVIRWTVIVTNNGPDAASKVYIYDILPNGLIYKAHSTTKGMFDSNAMVWYIEALENGESQTLTIDTMVDITNTNITNIVYVTSDTPDSNKTNNEANNTTDVPPEADIGVVKQVNASECIKDQFVEWKIIMTNHGPDGASNVIVKDNLPDTLIYVSSDGNYNPETGIWTIDYLASGETRVLTIITKINTTGMVIVNNVTAASGIYDPDMSNNNASNSTTVVDKGTADLKVVKVVDNANPRKGDTVTWTITVTNKGPDTAMDVAVTDKLPNGLKFVSANGNYDKDSGVWTVGDLKKGESKSLVIRTIVTITNARITNVAVANSTTPDLNESDNRDNDTVSVDPEADIKVTKVVSNPSPVVGDTITWAVVVVNLGPDAAKGVVVEEYLPDGLTLLKAKGSKGNYTDGIWTIGTLNNGEIVSLVLTTKVTQEGTIENIVVAKSSTYDPNETNNRDKEETNPTEGSADLEIIKVANKKQVKVGDKIIWTITVVNHGPNKAVNVRVSDFIDGYVKLLSAIVSKGKFDSQYTTWTIGDMAVGESVVLQLTGISLDEGEVINVAVVESDTPDPNEENNQDVAIVEMVGDSDNPSPAPSGGKHPKNPSTPKMHATGNPIVIVLLALLAVAGASLRRKY